MENLKCCGRMFHDNNELKKHKERRHKINDKNIIENKENKISKNNDIDLEYYQILLKSDNLNKVNEKIDSNLIIKCKEKLNKKWIFDVTKKKKLTDINELDISNQELTHFDQNENLNFKYFSKLNKLNINNNFLISLGDISLIYFLNELDLSNNKLNNWIAINNLENLKILKVNNNFLDNLLDIKENKNLKIIDVSYNKLNNLQECIEIFKNFNKLKDLTIKFNPCTKKLSYTYDILSQIKLKNLDNKKITEGDYDLAKNYFKVFKDNNEDINKNDMYKSFQGNFRKKLINLAKNNDKEYIKIKKDLDEVDKDKYYELLKENKRITTLNNEINNKNENLNYQLEEMNEKLEEIKEENELLKFENNNMYKFIEENNNLKNQIKILKENDNNKNNENKEENDEKLNSKEVIIALNEQINKYIDLINKYKDELKDKKYINGKRNRSTYSKLNNTLNISNNSIKNADFVIVPNKNRIKLNAKNYQNNINNNIKNKKVDNKFIPKTLKINKRNSFLKPIKSINENDEIENDLVKILGESFKKLKMAKELLKDLHTEKSNKSINWKNKSWVIKKSKTNSFNKNFKLN